MTQPNVMTPEWEAYARAKLKEAFKNRPRPKPPEPPKQRVAPAQQFAERCATKPIEAKAQDVALSCDALAESLCEERAKEFTDKEIAQRQATLDLAYEATKRVQAEITLSPYRGVNVGRGDSDYHLHQSPEDQLWGKIR